YLPNGGTPGVLSHNYTNPALTPDAGEFGSQVLAFKFNVNYSAAGYVKPGFNNLIVASGPLAGMTTTQVLTLANTALSGNTGVLTPLGLTVSTFTNLLGSLNGNYDNCSANNGLLR